VSAASTSPRVVIFDFDGTLVDSQLVILEAMTRAFERAGLAPRELAAVRRVVGLSLEDAIARLLDGEVGDGEVGDGEVGGREIGRVAGEVAALYRGAFLEMRTRADHHEPLFAGVRETVTELAASRLLGIATGKSRRGLFACLDRHGLRDHFSSFQTADLNPGKPHPQMVERALDELGATPGEAVLVGDTVFDMEMAANAGVRAIGVSWGYHEPEELSAAGAACILNEMADLVPLLAGTQEEAR